MTLLAPPPERRVRAVPGGPAVNGPWVVLVRWAALVLGAVVVIRSGAGASALLYGAPFGAVALARTFELRGAASSSRSAVWAGLVAELAVTVASVGASGGLHSGWVVVLVVEVALLGALVPSKVAGSIASGGAIGLFLFNVAAGSLPGVSFTRVDADGLLTAAALATAYASWVFGHGERRRLQLSEENGRLMATNDLLVTLERTAMRGDGLSDPAQAARVVAGVVGELLDPGQVTVALAGPVPGAWRVLLSDGGSQQRPFHAEQLASLFPDQLPPTDRSAVAVGSSLVAPLLVRDRLIGALVVERSGPAGRDTLDTAALDELAIWAGLLIDNACRFNALWVAGAAEERARIARDLHDHLGQSMAALGLELDGVCRHIDDVRLAAQVKELRSRVTAMVADLRFTMRQLRCDVTADKDLGAVLGELVRQLNVRFGADASLTVRGAGRLPLTQEHQLLLVARPLLSGMLGARVRDPEIFLTGDPSKGCLHVGFDGVPPGPERLRLAEVLAEAKIICDGVGATFDYEAREDGSCAVTCGVLR